MRLPMGPVLAIQNHLRTNLGPVVFTVSVGFLDGVGRKWENLRAEGVEK
jgi:hypothetical protein